MDGEAVYPEQAYELELLGFEQVYEGAHIFSKTFSSHWRVFAG
jgi:hypothetical protein